MTQAEKNIIIEHAQDLANAYFNTPDNEMLALYMAEFFTVSALYHKLTGIRIQVNEEHIVEEV